MRNKVIHKIKCQKVKIITKIYDKKSSMYYTNVKFYFNETILLGIIQMFNVLQHKGDKVIYSLFYRKNDVTNVKRG